MLCDGQGVFFWLPTGRSAWPPTRRMGVPLRVPPAHMNPGAAGCGPARTATPCSAWSERDPALPGAVRCARTGESSSPPSDTTLSYIFARLRLAR